MDVSTTPHHDHKNIPTSLMLMSMMQLLQPNAVLLLRETNRTAVGAFTDFKSLNDDLWPLDMVLVGGGEEGDMIGGVDPVLRVAPFPLRTIPKTPLSTERYRRINTNTASKPTPKLSVTIDVEEQLSKHGARFLHIHGNNSINIPCAPLPPPKLMYPVTQLGGSSGIQVLTRDGDENASPSLNEGTRHMHVCKASTSKGEEAPMMLELAYPTNFVKNFRYFDADPSDITVVVSCGGSDGQLQRNHYEMNTLPARLVDVFLTGSSVELRRDKIPQIDEWEAALGHTNANITACGTYGVTRTSLVASALSDRKRDNASGTFRRTQRFELPEDAICETCGEIPVPVVWTIVPDFMAHCFSAVTFGRDENVAIRDEDDIHKITIDMSQIRNVVSIQGAFLYNSAVSNVLLPTMRKEKFVSKEVRVLIIILTTRTLKNGLKIIESSFLEKEKIF